MINSTRRSDILVLNYDLCHVEHFFLVNLAEQQVMRNILLAILAVIVISVVIGICRCQKTTDTNLKHNLGTMSMGGKYKFASADVDSVVNLMIGNADFCTVTVGEGLPSQDVRSLLKGSDGYVWIGTSCGIGRYDGAHLYVYSATANDNIWSMAELDADTMLVGLMVVWWWELMEVAYMSLTEIRSR